MDTTWIPKKQEEMPVEKIMNMGKDKAWVPPVMTGLVSFFCTAIILSLLRPPLVVYKTSDDRPEQSPRLQVSALFLWSLIAGVAAAMILTNGRGE
jgi:hypothetical protein